jgi:site-specific DNA-methyltransferase (adenine-specific)
VIQETKVSLHLGDCVAGMAKLPANSVNLCVTSPPYNLGINYSKYDDSADRPQYLKWTSEWAQALHRVLADNGSLFLNVGGSPSNPMLPHEILLQLRDTFTLQNTIHWIKSITVETRSGEMLSTGHFKPIRSNRFVTDCHEFIFHLTKNGNTPIDRLGVGVPYADKSNIKRWGHTGGRDKRCRGNTWFIPYQTIQSRDNQRPHPATFPKDLPKMCIQLHGWRSDLVMIDPFLGIGNSALAALECEIKEFIGFEIDSDYLKTAKEQVASARAAMAGPTQKKETTRRRAVLNNRASHEIVKA